MSPFSKRAASLAHDPPHHLDRHRSNGHRWHRRIHRLDIRVTAVSLVASPMARLNGLAADLQAKGYSAAFGTLSYTTRNPSRIEVYMFAEQVSDRVITAHHEWYSDLAAALDGVRDWVESLPEKAQPFVHGDAP